MKTYKVSRNTVRRAIDTLGDAGLIYRDQGRGMFFIPQTLTIQTKIDKVEEHFMTLSNAGFKPSVTHIDTRQILADKELKSQLAIPLGGEVVVIEKLFLANKQPAILSLDYIATSKLGSDRDLSGSGMNFFSFLEECCDLRVEYILSDIVPVNANKSVASHLGIKPGDAVLLLKELFLDPTQQTPLAFAENYYLPSLVQFKILRRRE